jgi:FHS family L-fucose permease-like MFS transporter
MGTSPRTGYQLLPPFAAAGQVVIWLVMSLFFVRGVATALLYSLVPKLKSVFGLSYTEVMMTQFYFFLGYLFFSPPAGQLLVKLGYMRSIVCGLLVVMTGSLLFLPAAWIGSYPGFLAALFVGAAGITLLQVVSNPLIAVIGPRQSSHSRLTLAQAFNSFGTTVGPLIGAWVFFGAEGLPHAYAAKVARTWNFHAAQILLLVTVGLLATAAIVFWLIRDYPVPSTGTANRHAVQGHRLRGEPRFLFGVISIFAYVGAEVAVGSVMINYLMQPTVLSISAFQASKLVSLYWGGALLGRLAGSAILRVVSPAIALFVCAGSATLLAILSLSTTGPVAAGAIILIGLSNSIMFPTIFALAIEGLGDRTPQASSILCMAIIGGAIVPLLTGFVADIEGLTFALVVPAVCYLWVALYGFYVRRHPCLQYGDA